MFFCIFQYLFILQNYLYLSYLKLPLKLVNSTVLNISSVFKDFYGSKSCPVCTCLLKPEENKYPVFLTKLLPCVWQDCWQQPKVFLEHAVKALHQVTGSKGTKAYRWHLAPSRQFPAVLLCVSTIKCVLSFWSLTKQLWILQRLCCMF